MCRYCFLFGSVPFAESSLLKLYTTIRTYPPPLDRRVINRPRNHLSDDARNLLEQLLNKDPAKRMTMPRLRAHAWVTRHDTDPMDPWHINCGLVAVGPDDIVMTRALSSMHTVVRHRQIPLHAHTGLFP